MKKQRIIDRVISKNDYDDLFRKYEQSQAQLTDALETIKQNRLTIERMQNIINEGRWKLNSEDRQPVKPDEESKENKYFREIALRLARHLSSMPLDEMDLPDNDK